MRNMTKAGGKQGGGCEAEVGDWGKAREERKQGRKRKVKKNSERQRTRK